MSATWQRLVSELQGRAATARFQKRGVELFLGSDREIGRARHALEKRVGIIPDQVRALRELFDALHLRLQVYVLRGAGERAGYPDDDFIRAGAEIVTDDQLEFLDGPPDVVHALKEPSTYEARIPRPFCRIGALHTGDFGPTSGLGELLLQGNVAVFDGSNIGAPATRRIPIRGRMSVFAGEIAADWLLEFLSRHRAVESEVAVVGAGYAGRAAVAKLFDSDLIRRVHLFDSATRPEQIEALARHYAGSRVEVRGIAGVDDPALLASLEVCSGLLLAVAAPGKRAPKVVHVETLRRMRERSLVVDISIDERGAILDPTVRESWLADQIIPHLEQRIGGYKGHEYRAITNMPRAFPEPASKAHGEVILPYLATLLYLAAETGGPMGLVKRLTSRKVEPANPDPEKAEEGSVLEALAQDLRNGLAFWPLRTAEAVRNLGAAAPTRTVIERIVADRDLAAAHLYRGRAPFELELDGQGENVSTFSDLDGAVRSCLAEVQKRRIACSFVCHPGQDGTRTEDAARALGVPEGDVLKCLIVCRAPDGVPEPQRADYAAVICEGNKHFDEALLSAAAGGGAWRLASKREVLRVTGHSVGGVSVVEVFEKVDRVFLSRGIMGKERVWSSAGSEFTGMGLAPRALLGLGGIVADLTPTDSAGRRNAGEIRHLLEAIEKAIEWDNDAKALHSAERLLQLLKTRPH